MKHYVKCNDCGKRFSTKRSENNFNRIRCPKCGSGSSLSIRENHWDLDTVPKPYAKIYKVGESNAPAKKVV